MKTLTITLFSLFILSACSSSAPEPKSWKNDLSGIQEEQINNPKIVDEINSNKDVWSK